MFVVPFESKMFELLSGELSDESRVSLCLFVKIIIITCNKPYKKKKRKNTKKNQNRKRPVIMQFKKNNQL